MSRITYAPRTPAADSAAPKKDRDVREVVAPHALRLTNLMLAPSAGDVSSDRYVRNLRKDVSPAKGKRHTVLQALAIAYDDIQRGRSVADVTRWFHEAIALVELWADERDAGRITPPDLLPFLKHAQRAESAADFLEPDVASKQDCPETLEQYERALSVEIEKDCEALDAVRERKVRLRGGHSAAVPASRSLAGAGR